MSPGVLDEPTLADPRPGDEPAAGKEPARDPRPPLLLGDEAVALAALDAGIGAAYAYPGTPSTEIFEYLTAHAEAYGATAHWATNEKTAYEQALGASMAGRRVLVAMKHVGLNVAMDPFVNSALVDIRGGLVVVVADDPGMHSSQNEQDSRVLADFARVPCLEPATQQEAYEMTRAAFAWSERHRVPVLVRLVTRLCHGRAEVRAGPRETAPEPRPTDARDWTLLPGNARRLWAGLLERQDAIRREVAASPWVRTRPGSDHRRVAVLTAGIARNYVEENLEPLGLALRHLHVGAYPPPEEAIRELAHDVDELLVLEEGYPFLEQRLRGIFPTPVSVRGRATGDVPATGELTPESVRAALGLPARPQRATGLELPMRPPQLCRGCPHRDAFQALNAALEGEEGAVVAGDIGCYTLGALPPYQALESCVCMGASIGMAKGAADAGRRPAVAVIGDSTFLHSGITPLVDAAAHDTDMTVLILDNGTVAMTGQQPTALPHERIESVIRGVGVAPDQFHVVDTHPRKVDELTALIRDALDHRGLSVILARRECIESARKRKAEERRAARAQARTGDGEAEVGESAPAGRGTEGGGA